MPTITYRENTKRYNPIIRLAVILAHLVCSAILAFVFWTSGEVDWRPVYMLVFSALIWVLIGAGTDRKVPRTLTLDDTGLTFTQRSTSRHWHWTQLSAAETLTGSQSVPYVRVKVDGIIDWKARMALTESWSKSEIRFHGIYDTPLQVICDTFNEYRDRALGGAIAPAQPVAAIQRLNPAE